MSYKTSIKPYQKTPKMLVKAPRLTIRQMANKIPNETRLKSRIVGVEDVKKGRVPAALEGYTCYRLQTRNIENSHQYRISIYSPTPKITLDTKVIIDSPVPAFVFKYEHALAKRGNAFIYRSNGDPPVQTNPRLIPGFDHHSYRCLQYLIKNTTKNGLKEPDVTPERVRRTRRNAR